MKKFMILGTRMRQTHDTPSLEGAKSTSTPTSDERPEAEEPLDHERYKRYQSVCARANLLSTDRIDLQFAAKECCRAMSKPTVGDWALGRYLVGRPRMRYTYIVQEHVGDITAYSNANWASSAGDRESTSGGIVMHGSHDIKSWSKTQSLVARSSAVWRRHGYLRGSLAEVCAA